MLNYILIYKVVLTAIGRWAAVLLKLIVLLIPGPAVSQRLGI